MSRRLARLGLVLALITGAAASAAAPVGADTSISVTPAIVDLTGEAGSRGRIPITITNRGDEPIGVATSVAIYEDLTGDRSAVEWIRVRPDLLEIEPGDSREATLVVRIPQDIVSGGRYALVNLSTVAPEGESVAISGRIAVPILLSARGEGPLVGELVLERFASFVEADGRLGFRATIRNDGQRRYRSTGQHRRTSRLRHR